MTKTKTVRSIGTDAVNSLIHTFFKQKTRAVIHPFKNPDNENKSERPFQIEIFHYAPDFIIEEKQQDIATCLNYKQQPGIKWLNLEGAHQKEVLTLANHYGIHVLIQEDIMSYGQRPKMDEVNNIMFALMNMLYYNSTNHTIEQEQISIVLGENFIISFQEDAHRDVFNPIRERLHNATSKLRQYPVDYLFYSMIDIIVDSYFGVIEKVGERIEMVEDTLMHHSNRKTFDQINLLRKDLILLKRNTTPVRDLVSAILRSDNKLLQENTTKYYKDIYDHIMQANDLVDNYRDLVATLQDMYFNNMNMRMNEVMKTLAIVTTVMAPATVIGGIFGMNFDIIPYAHHKWGFYATVGIMVAIPLAMIWWFRKRGWFAQNGK